MTSTTPRAPRKTATRARKSPAVTPIASVPNVCRSCHMLPTGSMELMALMLVLVFSLTAVLFTSVYALNLQEAKVQALESQVTQEYAAQHHE